MKHLQELYDITNEELERMEILTFGVGADVLRTAIMMYIEDPTRTKLPFNAICKMLEDDFAPHYLATDLQSRARRSMLRGREKAGEERWKDATGNPIPKATKAFCIAIAQRVKKRWPYGTA